MNHRASTRRVGGFLALLMMSQLGVLAKSELKPASEPGVPLAINAISAQETSLVFDVTIPAGLGQVVLEMRLGVDAAWEESSRLEVPPGSTEMTFRIPRPAMPMAFFRLKGNGPSAQAALVSEELNYVTIPPLQAEVGGDAVFHFKGTVDGSDKIVINRDGAWWNHLHWGWPSDAVTVNGIRWSPKEKNYLTTLKPSKFLPETFSLRSATLEVIESRDTIALECAENAVIVCVDDTPLGASEYEFKIHFPAVCDAPKLSGGTSGLLTIAARIDGSDVLRITRTNAVWEHKAWAWPREVTLNGIAWLPQETPVFSNEGTNTFLPAGIDLSTARVVSRKGRDLAAMHAEKEALWVWFADNPNGDDFYELKISFH